jgi:hypothetical protein
MSCLQILSHILYFLFYEDPNSTTEILCFLKIVSTHLGMEPQLCFQLLEILLLITKPIIVRFF